MKVILKNVRLSGSPEAKVVRDTDGINNELNETVDGRKYCVVELVEKAFLSTTKRIISYSMNEDGKWPGMTPKELKTFEGSDYPGARVVTQRVKEYSIGERKVSTYSTIILPKENVETVFRNAGHTLETVEYVDEGTGEVLNMQKQPS